MLAIRMLLWYSNNINSPRIPIMKKKFFTTYLLHACVYCTVAAFLTMAVKLIGAGESIYAPTFSVARMTGLLFFAVFAALADRLVIASLPSNFFRYIIHFFIHMVSFSLFIYLPLAGETAYESALAGKEYEVPTLLAAIGIGAVIYAVIYTPFFIILAKKNKKANNAKDYKSVYKK